MPGTRRPKKEAEGLKVDNGPDGQIGSEIRFFSPAEPVEFKSFPASKVASLPMLLLAGSPLQGPVRGDGRSGAGGAEMRHQGQSSDGDTSEYSGSSSEEGEAPVSVGTKRDHTRQRTAAPGLENGGGGAAGGAGGGGPGGQQEFGGGGGFWQIDDDGMDTGGRSTSTPAAGTAAVADGGRGGGGPGGQQEIGGGGGGGDGGAAEGMDRDGAEDGGGEPCWAEMTRNQRKKWKKRGGRERLAPTI